MNQKHKTLIGLVAFAVFIAAAVLAYTVLQNNNAPDNLVILGVQNGEDTPTEPGLTPDDEPEHIQAPNFTMLDAEGNELQLSDFFGKPIVLNFWATWCPACVRETSYFQWLYEEHGDDVHVIKVNLLDGQRETRAGVDNFMYERDYTFPLFFDVDGAAAYGVRGIPVTFFIDEHGYGIAAAQGSMNRQTLQQGLEAIGVQ
ncbi:MAG: redoxin domain-containing protein [Firmicutes bacterium]|nr:redoxin domain-containing protein [Bacillota bacterium]